MMSPDWIVSKKATINPKNEKDNESFKWSIIGGKDNESFKWSIIGGLNSDKTKQKELKFEKGLIQIFDLTKD